jgi:hypothetical protein
MPMPEKIKKEIDWIVGFLVEVGLAGDQNYAFLRNVGGKLVEVTFPQAEHVSIALKDRDYSEIYEHLSRERAYNAKMPDGAIIQMMYIFVDETLQRHRLAFFPAPHLEEFQNNPDIYLDDEIFADVIARSVVPFPIRFDYDVRDRIHQEVAHPKSHLSLGQYENCRIPVTAPMTPIMFIDFILRNFYHTATNQYANSLPRCNILFAETICLAERGVLHVTLPKQRN